MTQRWQPISTAPRDGTEVIVGFVCGGCVWITRGARFVKATDWMDPDPAGADGWWSYENSFSQEMLDGWRTPTHWIERPKPPDGAD